MAKKLLSLLIIILSFNTLANAQAALLVLIFGDRVATENFYFSWKGAINASRHIGIDDSKMAIGPYFALTGTVKINDKWDFVPEFAALSTSGARKIPYSSTGNSELDNLLGEDVSIKRINSYFDFPMIVHYNINEKIGIGGGFMLSYLTVSKNLYEGNGINYTKDSRNEVRTVDYGFALDFKYTLVSQRSGKGIDILARYYQGFPNSNEASYMDPYKRSYFQIGVGFPFVNNLVNEKKK